MVRSFSLVCATLAACAVAVGDATLGPTKWHQLPLTYSETPLSTRKMAPTLGENTESILTEMLDYTWDDIAELQDEGVIL